MPVVHGRPSILPPSMYGGVMCISGYPGLGKTTLAIQADVPDSIAFFDFEDKGAGWHEQLGFGLYKAPVLETGGESSSEVWAHTRGAFESLEQDRYAVAILDNISVLEAAITADVAADPQRYSKRYGFSVLEIKKDSFGKARSCVNQSISALVAQLHQKGIKCIIAISHLGSFYKGGQEVPNKKRVRGRNKWQELSVLSLILVPGDHPPIPSAIVRKEQLGLISAPDLSDPEVMARVMNGQGGHTVQRRLPQRMPLCTFAHIRRYLSVPADMNVPEEGEDAVADEVRVFNDALSQAQLNFVVTANQAAHDAMQANATVVATVTAAKKRGGGLSADLKKPAPPDPPPPPAVAGLIDEIRALRLDHDDEEIRAILLATGQSTPIINKAFREAG